MELIKSTANSRIKAVASLKDSSKRREIGRFVAEGVRIVKDSPLTPVEVYVTEDNRSFGERYENVCNTFIVSDEVFAKISDTKSPQGVLAVYDIPKTKCVAPKGDYAIVLDGVTDPGNVGTVIRTAAACGFKDVYLVESADPYAPKVVRSSMGGVFRVQINIGERNEVIAILKDSGREICTLDMGGESVFDAKIAFPVALVLGSEARGVSEEFTQASDKVLALPMKDDTESLNAGISAGVAMYLISFTK